MRTRLTLLLIITAACGGSETRSAAADSATVAATPSTSASAAAGRTAAPESTSATSTRQQAGTDAASTRPNPPASIVRALYVNRWVSQSSVKMRRLIEIADSTEINAMVIDVKDEFGLN